VNPVDAVWTVRFSRRVQDIAVRQQTRFRELVKRVDLGGRRIIKKKKPNRRRE
jgi:hypothetical protein